MSSFAVGGVGSVTFTANMDGFNEEWPTLLRQWDFEAFLAASGDYATLITLYSYPVSITTCPSSAGATMFADVGGGAGRGTLTLDNVLGSPFNAVLTRIGRPSAYPGGGRRCRLTLQEVP